MRKRILYLLLLMSVTLWGQSSDQNYIVSKTYKVATTSSIALPTPAQAVTQVQYFDGLGRPIQNVTYAQGGNGKDIITHIEYDPFGRQTKEFLPYAGSTTSLNYHTAAAGEVATFYNTSTYENTTNPYSEKLLENSPLNRLFKQAAPGNVWNMGTNHEIKFDYQTNSVSEVRLYNVTTTWNATTKIYNIALTGGSTSYAPAQLYKNVTVDENTTGFTGARTEEFKDKEGRVVLKRVWATVDSVLTKHDTYYVYDIYGNLTYVIPPEAAVNTLPGATVLNELCYQYKYDHRNRLVAKKLPGKQWEFIIYDKLDRVRATGPVLSPFSNSTSQGWLYTKYDVFNRTVLTAWVAASSFTEATRLSLQNAVDAVTLNETRTANSTTVTTVNGIAFNYTNVSYPTSGYHVLTANYYDNYNYKDAPTDFASVLGQTLRNPSSTALSCKTLPTGSWVRTLEATTNYNGSLTATQYEYDRMASPIRVKTSRVSGGYTQVDSNTDFEGKTIQTVTRHKRTSADTERVTTEDFTYTAQSRLLSHTHKIGSGTAQLLSYNTYDALGQLTSKKVGNTSASPLQKVDYSYNIRGWLTGINNTASLTDVPNDLFAFKLNYNTTASGLSGVTGLFNGNIAETYWKTASDNNLRLYGYQYDGLNRLSKAWYKNNNNGFANTYNESLTYDLNGNIKTLQRNGGTESTTAVAIDNLTYTYDATAKNKLLKVVDATNSTQGFKDDYTFGNDLANDYTYDANGNMTVDQNKGITAIVYNHLNLPSKITFGTTGTINYLYDAAGVKLQKKVTQGTTVTTTDYLGGYQYTDNVLDFFPTAEGYVNNTLVNGSNTYNYVYNYTDHLGNIRLSYTKDPTTGTLKIIEENHNYPFGLKHNYNTTDYQFTPSGSGLVLSQVGENGYNYQYNGKEWQDELGLAWYDYGARNYDASLGRWMNVDNKSEIYFNYSPYSYAANIPTFFIDPNGEYIYLHYYLRNNHKNGEHDKEADQMFWAAAMTRAVDFINSDESSTGDILIFKAIDDMDDLESTIENDIADNKETYGETAEFGLWSHGGNDGPFRENKNGTINQLSINNWGKIDFNWSSDANAYFYGCRTARGESEKYGKSFVERLSIMDNMKDVNVWGQSTRSWPSPYTNMRLSTDDIQNGIHHVPTYLVGSSKGLGDRTASILQVPSQSTPMAIYKNGFFQYYSHQPGRLMPKNRPISIPLNMHYRR